MDNRRTKFLVNLARAYYDQGLTQEQIALGMSISRSQVSRYLTEAREKGIVQFRVIDPDERNEDLRSRILARFPHLRAAVVVQSFSEDPAINRQIIGIAGARFLRNVLHAGDCLCIGCGRAVRALVAALKVQSISNLSVVQAMGSLGHEALDIDFNELTRATAAAFCARPNYLNTPAILGSGTAAELEAANVSIRESLSLARAAEIFVLGLGSVDSDQLYVRVGLITPEDIRWLKDHHIAGDICARFFDAEGREQITPFSDRVVGVGLREIGRARASIALATGADKVLPTRAALYAGLINVLVTDEITALAVLALDEKLRGGDSAKFPRKDGPHQIIE